MIDGDVLLIVAISARALAQSARRARLTPVAIDAFGDEDARGACAEFIAAPDAGQGFARVDIEALVAPLVRTFAPKGVVYGSGFDDCPGQLRLLARHGPLLGASPSTVATAKDPVRFAKLCAQAGLRHPEIAMVRPSGPEEWLLKRAGGCGGLHIRDGLARAGSNAYWQRRAGGKAVSLLFTRDETGLAPLAWSEQWTAPTPSAPYRYGGAAGPLEPRRSLQVPAGLADLATALDLRGLASADFLDDGENLWLLEINPRPGATLDVFDDDADPLIQRHLSAVAGRAATAPILKPPKAAAVVYAKRRLIAPDQPWPEWVSDRPTPGIAVPDGAPLCTIHAEGETIAGAKTLLSERTRRIHEFAERFAA